LRGAGRGRGRLCSSACGPWAPRGVGCAGGGVRLRLGPPLRLEAFLGAPWGACVLGVTCPCGQWLLQVRDLPRVSAIVVRCCRFGSSQNGNGLSNALATRDVTVVPVLSGGGRRPRPTCRDILGVPNPARCAWVLARRGSGDAAVALALGGGAHANRLDSLKLNSRSGDLVPEGQVYETYICGFIYMNPGLRGQQMWQGPRELSSDDLAFL
jgi:hypothetical protein